MGGYCTIELAERVTATRHRARLYWWIGGAITMAIGTWSMHYTGMLALRLPVPLLYDWPTAFLSYLASLFASLIGLFVVSRRKMGIASIFAGSVFMGGGIAGLHYIAMGSMRLKAMHDYSPPIVTLSALAAVAFSLLSLWLMFLFRDRAIGQRWRKFGSSLLLGAAISVMHYIGMAAVTFHQAEVAPDFSHAVPINDLGIIGIGAANVMVLVVVLLDVAGQSIAKPDNDDPQLLTPSRGSTRGLSGGICRVSCTTRSARRSRRRKSISTSCAPECAG